MISSFEQTLIALQVVIIMLGMGAALTPKDFLSALRRPTALGIGVFSQYAFMPLTGFLLTIALSLPASAAVGILIMSCMPGGTTSNMFTYFSRGDVALSILMTVTSTVLGILLIPILLILYASALQIEIPTDNIVTTLLVILIPVGVGMGIRAVSQKAGAVTERVGSWVAILFILFIIVSWVPRNWEFLTSTAPNIHLAAMMLGIIGMAVGYGLAKTLRHPERIARTVSLETGIQNGPLAFAIIALSFSGTEQQSILGVAALYSFYIMIMATLVTLGFRRLAA
ncbi:bile acid:sodium symporter [uncultured Roseibium sp.]|uniref:bile acid:sodium symporter family protein n=1 Tax=uncultured Roseibium sp. TaxID=1936171 RepID=UPI002637EAC5|nr:bile acid:sodium symporter [uncultured Roseibium sp.]